MTQLTLDPAPDTPPKGWEAHLHLRFEKRKNKTVLSENRHRGPLSVQRPWYPEDEVCHACILHPPGGVVGGDSLHLDLIVEQQGTALITTPGATKFYRSGGAEALQRQLLQVNEGSLEWFPQDTILHPGARARIDTNIRLTTNSRFIGWEVTSLGLPSSNNLFTSGTLMSSLKLLRDDIPLFYDCLRIEGPEDLGRNSGLRGFGVCATFLATDVEATLVAELRELLPPPDEEKITSITLMDSLLVGRYLGYSTFEARHIFEKIWNRLRPVLLKRDPCPPRIWAT